MSLLKISKPSAETKTLIDELLGEQRSLTAVDRFARAHSTAPAQEKFYRDLIPLSLPKPGEQYAFEVDLDKCSACKACVTACHTLNGLDEEENWREVGLLHSEDWRAPFQANVTTACHHCVDPGCLNGCPVLAYDKDPVTGIVRHLDDQCIGCQYCVMKCPYDAPKYSAKRGIVRKCDMCSNRLAQGEAPACVQACPSKAIRVTVVNQRDVSEEYCSTPNAPENLFLPASPVPQHTIPATRYVSARPLPASILAGDHARVSPAEPHLPLVFMLVLSQLAVGLDVTALFGNATKWSALVSFAITLVALGSGALHLGQPLKAWRCFLGWRTSWFSREVIAFALFAPLCGVNAFALWVLPLAQWQTAFAWLAALTGILAVACSAMIYVDTHREFWRASQSFGKFFGSTMLLGCAGALALNAAGPANHAVPWIAGLLSFIGAGKLALEQRVFRDLVDEETPAPKPLNKTARLLASQLGVILRWRMACGILGGIVLPFAVALDAAPSWLAATMFVLCLTGELLERYLFFTAVAPEKMPGGALD